MPSASAAARVGADRSRRPDPPSAERRPRPIAGGPPRSTTRSTKVRREPDSLPPGSLEARRAATIAVLAAARTSASAPHAAPMRSTVRSTSKPGAGSACRASPISANGESARASPTAPSSPAAVASRIGARPATTMPRRVRPSSSERMRRSLPNRPICRTMDTPTVAAVAATRTTARTSIPMASASSGARVAVGSSPSAAPAMGLPSSPLGAMSATCSPIAGVLARSQADEAEHPVADVGRLRVRLREGGGQVGRRLRRLVAGADLGVPRTMPTTFTARDDAVAATGDVAGLVVDEDHAR